MTQAESSSSREPIDVQALIAKLAAAETTAEEGEALIVDLDGREAEVALPLFAQLRNAESQAVVHAVSRLLSRWRDRPITQALVPALKAMLEEPGVADLNRMAAAGLLELYGQPVDYERFIQHLEDPSQVAQRALKPLLRAAGDPFALVSVLDGIPRMEKDRVLALIDDLSREADPRAAGILAALAHAPDADIAVSAVAAIDMLDLRACKAPLARVAEHHHDAIVRDQAAQTLERLSLAPAGANGHAGPAAKAGNGQSTEGRSLQARATARSEGGGRLLVLSAANAADPERRDVFALVLEERTGIGTHALVEGLGPDEKGSIAEAFAAGDAPLEDLDPADARKLLIAATQRSLALGHPASVAHVPWIEALG